MVVDVSQEQDWIEWDGQGRRNTAERDETGSKEEQDQKNGS